MKISEYNNLKIINKKSIGISLIVLALTFILGLILAFNIDIDFFATKTVFNKLFSSADVDNPGSGAQLLFSFFVSGFVAFGEFSLILLVILMFVLIPIFVNILLSLIGMIARLFLIGKYKKWKTIITKTLLYLLVVLQGILNVYLLILSFSGFGVIYVIVYLMLAINVFGFVKNIFNLKNLNN